MSHGLNIADKAAKLQSQLETQMGFKGRDLAQAYPECQMLFDKADEALGYPLSKLCFEGPAEELMKSNHCQPAIFVTSLACYRAFQRSGAYALRFGTRIAAGLGFVPIFSRLEESGQR